MNSKVNSKVNSKLDTRNWPAIDRQLLKSIENIKTTRGNKSYVDNREDWLDSMMYGLLFGTPEEIYRTQVQAKNEAEKEGRPYTPVFWTASEPGAQPVLTLWRI